MRTFDRGPCYMEESDNGDWVRREDAEAAIDAANQRADRAERYVDGQDLRSDFRTATEMRAALDSTIQSIVTACKGSGCLNAHELRAALDRTHKRATNAEKNLADAERRLALAVAEVKAWGVRYASKCPADAGTLEHTAYYTAAAKSLAAARAATNADLVLSKMIGGE